MKMLPVQLSLNPPLGLWSDVLWRCPPAPPSQLAELKTQLPASLPSDPRLWGREDVAVFLHFCEREFDLPKVDHELFQMNGKALCLLTRADFGHRCPGAGDVLHNVLQMLIIESYMMQWHLPNSPVTPTSRYPLSPHSHPPTPTWPPISGSSESPFQGASHMHHAFMAPNSVTLSPPPSVDSQASSPPQNQEHNANSVASANGSCANSNGSNVGGNNSNGSTTTVSVPLGIGSKSFATNNSTMSSKSNFSDSEDERYTDAVTPVTSANGTTASIGVGSQYRASPPTTPVLKDFPQSISQKITNSFVNWTQSQQQTHGQNLQLQNTGNGCGGSVSAPTTPSYMQTVKREFFPENSEPNTNGRLLWDFLQQLLNDRNQKYSDLIAWKCRDTGVFKIVDPAGLAKLWGIQKNHLSMNYDKMSRALRYYYRVNILRKVQGERHCYQFLRNPTELKNIKNISLLRQSINNTSTPSAAGTSKNGGITNGASSSTSSQAQSNQPISTNVGSNCSTNWALSHPQRDGNGALQQTSSSTAASGGNHQASQQSSSRSNGGGNHMNLPTISSSAAAAAAVAAAAAAYGPPPTSPLFMHAINGAFHYLSSNVGGQPPPNSPSALPPTSSEKFQFNSMKLEQHCHENNEEMKPTDLSVAGTGYLNVDNKRPYSNPSANEDCYPLIRNADGLTTIKLIRYNNESDSNETMSSSKSTQKQTVTTDHHQHLDASPKHIQVSKEQGQQLSTLTPMHMDSDGNENDGSDMDSSSGQYNNGMPLLTDLRK